MLKRPEPNAPLPIIEVTALTRVANAGNLRALATVRVGKVLIHDWRIVQQAREKPRIEPPRRVTAEKTELRYGGALIEFPAEVECAIRKRVLMAWAKETGEIYA